MAKDKTKKSKGGLSAKTFGGLNPKRMKSRAGNFIPRVKLDKGVAQAIQFLGEPDDSNFFIEIDQHQFKEDGQWNYVPCADGECPLCNHEREDVRKTHYRFMALVYHLADRQIQVLEGPKDLSGRIFNKYKRVAEKGNPAKFMKKVYEVTKLGTEPVSYEVDLSDDSPASAEKIAKLDRPNLSDYVDEQLNRYFGEGGMPTKSALDDPEDGKFKKEGKKKSKKSKK